MKHNLETIKKALKHHSETQDAVSFGYLNSQIREFEKELRSRFSICDHVGGFHADSCAFAKLIKEILRE